jgi:hypothetical protein
VSLPLNSRVYFFNGLVKFIINKILQRTNLYINNIIIEVISIKFYEFIKFNKIKFANLNKEATNLKEFKLILGYAINIKSNLISDS